MQFRDLGAQYESLKNEIDFSVLNAIRSGRYIGGEEVSSLEAELAGYVGTKYCITCGNGTDALQLALMAWGVGPGDAVFIPDFTFFSSGEAPAVLGATPVFVDVDAATFNMDPVSLESAVEYVRQNTTLKPRVVVAVDLFGQPANYPSIRATCDKYGLQLLEDGAQGFGGAIDGQRVCSFGDISTTSFFPAKPLGCYGDGGAVFTDSEEWAALVRSYAVHGKGKMKYDNIRLGMNSRLDTLQAAVLRVKYNAFVKYEIDKVNQAAAWYAESLADSGLILPDVLDGYVSSWAQYTVRLPAKCSRDAIQAQLKEHGIPTAVYYPKPMHEQVAFSADSLDKKKSICPGGCSVTESLCKTVLSLPMGPYLEQEEVEFIANTLIETVR